MPLRKWGGVSLFVCPPHIAKLLFPSSSILLLRVPFLLASCQIFRQSGQIFGKKGQNLIFICLPWCFLGKIGDRKGQNINIFLKVGAGGGRSLPAFHRVHRLQVVGSCGRWSGLSSSPVACSLLLCAFLSCVWCVACKYGSISRFKGVFSVFLLFRVGLLGLGALRGS